VQYHWDLRSKHSTFFDLSSCTISNNSKKLNNHESSNHFAPSAATQRQYFKPRFCILWGGLFY
jgi:hypothetical protein